MCRVSREKNNEAELENSIMNLLDQNGFEKMKKGSIEKYEVISWNILFNRIEIINKKKLKKEGIVFLSDFHKKNIKNWFEITVKSNKDFIKNISDATISFPINNNPESRIIYIEFIDYKNINNNIFNYKNQVNLRTHEKGINNRADLVVYLNGLPITIMELKDEKDRNALDVLKKSALKQINRYYKENQKIFKYNCFVNIINRNVALYGAVINHEEGITWGNCGNWLYINNEDYEKNKDLLTKYEIMIKGMYNKKRLLEFIRFFIAHTKNGNKIIGRYYQFYAVLKIFNNIKNTTIKTINANDLNGKINEKCGYANHSTGSGKSLSMIFLTNIIAKFLTEFQILIITDRLSLNEQLYENFNNYSLKNIANKKLVKPDNANELKELLGNKIGNIIFVNIQKFSSIFKDIDTSDKKYIVIVDEIHRTQNYEKNANDEITGNDGWAKILREKLLKVAYYTGFTATPTYRDKTNILKKTTSDLFGDELSHYTYKHAHSYDKSIVPIKFEARWFDLDTDDEILKKIKDLGKKISNEFKNWKNNLITTSNIIFNNETYISMVANDIYNDFKKYMDDEKEGLTDFNGGKAIVIAPNIEVAQKYLDKLRSLFGDTENKIIGITISNTHNVRNEGGRNKNDEKLFVDTFKDPTSDLKIVIVVDKWRTGFDAPHLAKLYVARPINDTANIFQTFSRVVRKFKDKKVGWVIDYTSEFNKRNWKEALRVYGGETNAKLSDFDRSSRIKLLEEEYNNKYIALFNTFKNELQEKIKFELNKENNSSAETNIRIEFMQFKLEDWKNLLPYIKNMYPLFREIYNYVNYKVDKYKLLLLKWLYDDFRIFLIDNKIENENEEYDRTSYDRKEAINGELHNYINEVIKINNKNIVYSASWEEITKTENLITYENEYKLKSDLKLHLFGMAEYENRSPDLVSKIHDILERYTFNDLKNIKILTKIKNEVNKSSKNHTMDFLSIFQNIFEKLKNQTLINEFKNNKRIYLNTISGFKKYFGDKLSDKIYGKIFQILANEIKECANFDEFNRCWINDYDVRSALQEKINNVLPKNYPKIIPSPANENFKVFLEVCFINT